ncbi:MAG: protein-export chaperone SecB [Terriglobales bacterium]
MEASFRDLSEVGEVGQKPGHDGMEIELKQGALDDGRRAVLRVRVRFLPAALPYDVAITVAGVFSTADGSPEQLDSFTKVNGPVILFPFIRAAVQSITSDGAYGPLRINPVNLTKLIDPKGWQTLREKPVRRPRQMRKSRPRARHGKPATVGST